MDIRISFSELQRGKNPLYEAGDTITVFGKGNITVSELSELRMIFSRFRKPYHLIFENIRPVYHSERKELLRARLSPERLCE